MRYGIISDIHSNLEALEAALATLGDIDGLLCPGDVIGYGPNPNECCERLRTNDVTAVLGNHDAAATGLAALDWFNPHAQEAVIWNTEQLTQENLWYLKSLPLVYKSEWFVMAHGSLSSPEQFDYIFSPWEAQPTFTEMRPYEVCFVGHTHVAEFYFQKADETWSSQVGMADGGIIELKPGTFYIVNCGSVGQPRDRNPKAAVGVYDTEARTVEVRRIEYPIGVTQQKMRDAGLPDLLWQRLDHGA